VHRKRKYSWLVIGGTACLFVLLVCSVLPRKEGSRSAASSAQTVTPLPVVRRSPYDQQNGELVQIPAAPPEEGEVQKEQLLGPTVSSPDKAAVEIHQAMVAGLNAELRERTRGLYGRVFQEVGLTANLQEKVIDILTQQQQQLEQQAFAAAQSGNLPVPPSPEQIRMQQVEQENQLRSVLGDAGFAQFSQYQATIPDRIMIDEMNQQGANLSESQSNDLLEVLGESRKQIFGAAGETSNLNSIPANQAMATVQQQQALLQQTVSDRIQSKLTPDQGKTLQETMARFNNIVRPGP
jgi:hypothetical protein